MLGAMRRRRFVLDRLRYGVAFDEVTERADRATVELRERCALGVLAPIALEVVVGSCCVAVTRHAPEVVSDDRLTLMSARSAADGADHATPFAFASHF